MIVLGLLSLALAKISQGFSSVAGALEDAGWWLRARNPYRYRQIVALAEGALIAAVLAWAAVSLIAGGRP